MAVPKGYKQIAGNASRWGPGKIHAVSTKRGRPMGILGEEIAVCGSTLSSHERVDKVLPLTCQRCRAHFGQP